MEFSKLSQKYLEHCQFGRATPVSKQTLISHSQAVKRFNQIFRNKEIEVLQLEDVLELKKAMIGRGCSLGYIQRNLCVFRSLIKFAEELGLQVMVPEKIRLPTPKAREVEYLFEDELSKIFFAIDLNTTKGIRLMALVCTMLVTGMRISEATSLNRGDIDFHNRQAYIIGKGAKKRAVMFNEWALVWINKYLALRADQHPALFATLGDQRNRYKIDRLNPRFVEKEFAKIRKLTGVYKFKPHALRRTFATFLRKKGADIKSIQELLGHSDLKVTERYLGTDYEFLKAVHARHVNYGSLEDIGLSDRRESLEKLVTAID